MKDGIHPDYIPAQISCACGTSFVTRSSKGDIQVDVCSKCHPFYTGTQKLMDAAGRVDRFKKRYAKKDAPAAAAPVAAAPAAAAPEAATATE
jgi:large subunit ribosomal protein L31